MSSGGVRSGRGPGDEAIVVDGVAPLLAAPRLVKRNLAALTAGGVDAAMASVSSMDSLQAVVENLAAWQAFGRLPDAPARVVTTVEAIRAAKRDNVLAIGLHAQGLDALASNVDLLNLYHQMGVRIAQPTYNIRNSLGDGCFESEDAGLSDVGRRVVERANALGVLLDISHIGPKTSMDMLELSARPVIASHSNARALCDTPRNISDDHIRAVAESGGVIGLCAFPAFVASEGATVEKLVDHAIHIADLVGPDRLAIGLDYAVEDEDDYEWFRYDPRYIPRPPWTWPTGIADWTEVPTLGSTLAKRGFSSEEVEGILGENLLSVYAEVWRD